MYTPKRDHRFEYLWDVMHFIEDNQCQDCAFAEPGEYPMCIEIASQFIAEDPIEQIDDLGDEGIECKSYKSLDSVHTDGQLELPVVE